MQQRFIPERFSKQLSCHLLQCPIRRRRGPLKRLRRKKLLIDETTIVLVLQHWLNCIQYSEALAVRPHALRTPGLRAEQINLRDPAEGRFYFKLSLEEIAFLLSHEEGISRDVDGEIAEFFESWLSRQYRLLDYIPV